MNQYDVDDRYIRALSKPRRKRKLNWSNIFFLGVLTVAIIIWVKICIGIAFGI